MGASHPAANGSGRTDAIVAAEGFSDGPTGRSPGSEGSSPVDEPWDRELTARQVIRLPRTAKAARLAMSMSRKVAIIVAAAEERPGTGLGGLPRDPTALRRWSDPAQKLWPWADREAEKREPGLIVQLELFRAATMALLSPDPRGRLSTAERLVAAEALNAAYRRQIASLVMQLSTRGPSLDDLQR